MGCFSSHAGSRHHERLLPRSFVKKVLEVCVCSPMTICERKREREKGGSTNCSRQQEKKVLQKLCLSSYSDFVFGIEKI